MTNSSSLLPPGIVEQFFHFFEQAGARSSHCRTNIIFFLEFDLLKASFPNLDTLKALIRQKLPALPCLHHLFDEQNGKLRWSAYQPDLEKMIVEKKISAQQLQDEIIAILKTKTPDNEPWKLVYLTGYAPNKFGLLWSIRHEILDSGGCAALLEEVFGQISASSLAPVPKTENAASLIPQHLLKNSASAEEAGLFWKNIPSSLERKIIQLQMPAQLLPAIGKNFSASGNDIYLTAMNKAIWKWRENYPAALPKGVKLPIIVPVNLRQPGDQNIGNCFYWAKINLSANSEPKDVAEQMNVFRQKDIRSALASLYKEKPTIAAAQVPSSEYFSATCSSFRITMPMSWEGNPLSRMSIAFDALAANMPIYSMLCTYAPKNTPQQSQHSILFFSFDSEIKGIEHIPALWKETVKELAKEAKIELSPFGEDPIHPFC